MTRSAVATERVDRAIALMRAYAERTGVTGSSTGRRYLWTDAFAVCNFLGLGAATDDAALSTLALEDAHREQATWRAHEDINDVMLATALAPDGFLVRRG